MYTRVDWISFSSIGFPFDPEGVTPVGEGIAAMLTEQIGSDLFDRVFSGSFTNGKGRKPYKHSFSNPDHSVSVFWGETLGHITTEISGTGCQRLDSEGLIEELLAKVFTRCTRLDIAVDIDTKTPVKAFADARTPGRFKAHEHKVSAEGETVYIGSYKSERFARVYRYNEPHPRAHLLRVEFVQRDDLAHAAAWRVSQGETLALAAELGNSYGLLHDDWQPDVITTAKAAGITTDRGQGNTLFWLNDTIAPLIARLHREGAIDAREWFDGVVLTKIDMSDTL